MLQRLITIQLLLSLLGSGWAQASTVSMTAPAEGEVAIVQTMTAVGSQDEPPCHEKTAPEQSANHHDMACCDIDCQCDAFCQSFSFDLPHSQKVEAKSNRSDLIAFSSSVWAPVPTLSLYRPPIS